MSVGVTPSGVGTYRFYLALEAAVGDDWFVTDQLDGFQFSFESLGDDEPIEVSVAPDTVTLPVNGTQSFTATVTGASDTSVSWSATCGSISGSGTTGAYTAPGSEGTCFVRATSGADDSAWAEATVEVERVGSPEWRASPTQLDFFADVGDPAPPSQSFTLHNDGSVSGSFALNAGGMTQVSPLSGTVEAGGSQQISVSVAACPDPGTTTSLITLPDTPVAVGVSRTCGEPEPDVGMIQVFISGLPSGVNADVFISGEGWMLWPGDSTLYADMPPGIYEMTARAVVSDGVTYEPDPTGETFSVVAGETTTVSVDYEAAAQENRPPAIDAVWMVYQSGERFECGSIIPQEYIGFHWTASDPDGDEMTYEYRIDGGSWRSRSRSNVNVWLDDRPPGEVRAFEVRAVDEHGALSSSATCTAQVSMPPEIIDYEGPEDWLGYRVGEPVPFLVEVRDLDDHYPSEVLLFVYPPGGGVSTYEMTLYLDQGADTRLTYVAGLAFSQEGEYEYLMWVTDALGVMADATDRIPFTIFP